MMSATRYLTETNWPGRVHLILSFRSPRDFIFREEIAALRARNANLALTVVMSQPGHESWEGPRGHIDAAGFDCADDRRSARARMRPALDDGCCQGRARWVRRAGSPDQDGGIRDRYTRSYGEGRCINRARRQGYLSNIGHNRTRAR